MPRLLASLQKLPERPEDVAPAPQYGVIPYRIVQEKVVFLLITSRRSANWVFPKGSPIKGLSPTETAAQEAFEEAGIRGEIAAEPVGTYLNEGNSKSKPWVEIHLYPMLVTEQVDEWPEEEQRFRHWVLLPEARKLLANKQAADLAVKLQRQLVFGRD